MPDNPYRDAPIDKLVRQYQLHPDASSYDHSVLQGELERRGVDPTEAKQMDLDSFDDLRYQKAVDWQLTKGRGIRALARALIRLILAPVVIVVAVYVAHWWSTR